MTTQVSKQELVKALRSNKKLYAYVPYNDNDGGYYQMVKSDFLDSILEMDDDTDFSNITINEKSIYIN